MLAARLHAVGQNLRPWYVSCIRDPCAALVFQVSEQFEYLTLRRNMSRSEVVAVSSDDEPSQQGGLQAGVQPHRHEGRCFFQWAPHEGFGLCRGIDGPCTVGDNDQPAAAGCDGLCDVCNLDELPSLHRLGQGRLTHLLLQLTEEKAEVVLQRIQNAVGEDLAVERRRRMRRARHRKSADRPRRGLRGPYKRRRTSMPQESMEESPRTTEELCEPEKDIHAAKDDDESAEEPCDMEDGSNPDDDEAESKQQLYKQQNNDAAKKEEPLVTLDSDCEASPLSSASFEVHSQQEKPDGRVPQRQKHQREACHRLELCGGGGEKTEARPEDRD